MSSALGLCIVKHDVDGCMRHVSAGTDVNGSVGTLRGQYAAYSGHTPLALAILLRRSAIVRELLENCAALDANASGKGGVTALMAAASMADSDTVTVLLKRDEIDLNLQNKKRQTALHVAAESNAWSCLYLLCTAASCSPSFDPNLTDASGNAILHLVVRSASASPSPLSSLLRCSSIDVNLMTRKHRTPLHLAVLARNVPAVEALLQHPSIVMGLRDGGGNTALDYAKSTDPDHIRIAQLISRMSGVQLADEDKKSRTYERIRTERKTIGPRESAPLLALPPEEEPAPDDGCSCALL